MYTTRLAAAIAAVCAGVALAEGLPAALSAPYDVVVVGGGPAGIGAALAAAKLGARTALVERDTVVGGTTVQAEVDEVGLFSAWRRQIIAGPAWDLVTNAVAAAHGTLPDFSRQEVRKWNASCVRVRPAVYARVAEETLRRAGVALVMGVEVGSAVRTAGGWRVGPVAAREVVDATGNATVAALAGAARVRSPDDERQPGSFFFHFTKGLAFDASAVDASHRAAVEKGELLATDVHIPMSSFVRNGGGWGCYIPLADNSTPEARAETNRRGAEARDRILAFIRRQPGLGEVALLSSAREVGVRETYRVVGEKTVSERDYLDGTVADDSLCWSFWMVDAHSAAKGSARIVFHEEGKVGTVPLGAMLPKGVPHMLVAGRAVSSDHGANSALRVQASCMAMGQAAGAVAALAASRRCDPREVPLADVKASLASIGHIVPSKP